MANRNIMTSRESSFNISLQSVPQSMQSVRLAYIADGTAIYKPLTSSSPATYQGGEGGGGGGGSPGAADTASASLTAHSLNMNMGELVKRKHGRPMKYGAADLALTSLSMADPLSPSGMGNIAPLSSTDGVKKRGRPPGSSNKQKMNALGINFQEAVNPHML
ncbi:AT-hook motif nuclear-localized protein 10-like [Curcuma longa]|uniref:AT-hook motif nuclear-localized protein 10-like n=1 Tax=Curcuma longa TaxID=136217 RepID=UPI003D9EE801